VAALDNDQLIHEAPAIVGCRTPSALAHAAAAGLSARRPARTATPAKDTDGAGDGGQEPGRWQQFVILAINPH
jgi:hypothetical protein